MFNRILVPTDGSALSDKAIDAAVRFARQNSAKVVGISVAEPYPFPPPSDVDSPSEAVSYRRKMAALAQSRVDKVAAAADAAGVPCETLTAQSFSPWEEIIRAAEKNGCDMIFMASHGRNGLSNLFVGSETQKVMTHSSIPVLVFR